MGPWAHRGHLVGEGFGPQDPGDLASEILALADDEALFLVLGMTAFSISGDRTKGAPLVLWWFLKP